MRLFIVAVVASAYLSLAASAGAAPVATSMPQYQAYGAVFPDPLAVCQQQCDPHSRGNTNATQFIGYSEFVSAISFMNQNKDWQRYMEVLPLDGHLGNGNGTKPGNEMAPGNNLPVLEFTPKKENQSAGLATTNQEQGTGKMKSDLIVVRVTDENVADDNKKRYTLSLSIHGIERAGVEGGTRAMEEIVTAVAEGRGDEKILPKEVRENAPTWRQVLANTIIYFTYPNPDGWRRGSVGEGGIDFQRYNGNGVDPNRDWPDIGFSFRRYSGSSEPETRSFEGFYRDIEEKTKSSFSAGDDLHGQPFADALSFTLLPHGRHNLNKDLRLREASKLINRAQYEATKWSPIIIDNDEGPANCQDTQAVGDACDSIYAQTWGSVYDTINYTTTGTLGDWFDSSVGLGADGIDNEMSFSHLDRHIAFEPQGEQLHVAGNKAIIYSHVSDLLRPPEAEYTVPVKSGYVASPRLTRARKDGQGPIPPGTSASADVDDQPPTGPDPATGSSFYAFTVARNATTYNGGMRIDVRTTNFQAVGPSVATLRVQCKGCDEHVGVDEDEDEWITVAEDFNQSPVYVQSGLTAAVNRPDTTKGDGSPVEWRALVDAPGGIPRFSIDFTSGPATSDGATGGDEPPVLSAYDVANTDFFDDLNGAAQEENDKFEKVDPKAVLAGSQSLDSFRTLVLADSALPGFTGRFAGEPALSGPPTANFNFAHAEPTVPSQGPDGCIQSAESTEEKPFTITSAERNSQVKVRITWSATTSDYDLFLYKAAAGRPVVGDSQQGLPPTTEEEIVVPDPEPGNYVIVVVNCTAPSEGDPWSGTVEFTGKAPQAEGDTGAYSNAEKDAWIAKLKAWVAAGGNLVLTDGALRGLSELTTIPGSSISRQKVYTGQSSFRVCGKFEADGSCLAANLKDTLTDPLAKNVAQLGARFNTGMRRQMFEPTPLGYAIQDPDSGADASFARQFDIDQIEFEKVGGRVAGASVDAGARDAVAIPTRTTLGEIPIGSGKIRVAGALLPQPSQQYDHPLGIEPYAVTYTGYIVFCNLVDCQYERKSRPPLANAPAPPGPVDLGFGASLRTPLLASTSTRNGRRVPVRIRKTGVTRIQHLQLQYRRTGRGTKRTYTKLRPRLKPTTKRIRFTKGRIGETYLLRIRAVGKNGIRSAWDYRRIVFPYDDRGKGRRYSSAWTRVKNRRAWRGGYTTTSVRGATLRFKTRGGGRVYLIGRTGPNGGRAVIRARGGEKRRVSFRSKKVRHRRVVAVINRTDKRALRFRLRVLRGVVAFDALGIRRR